MEKERAVREFNFHEADCGKFRELLTASLGEVLSEGSTEEWSSSFCGAVRKAAEKAKKSRVRGKRGKLCRGGIKPVMMPCRLETGLISSFERVQLRGMSLNIRNSELRLERL